MASILILDNSIALLEALQIILTGKGYKVITTCTTDIFMQVLQENKPELIILDVNFGNIDGREICKKLKEQEKTKDIPIILCSTSPQKLKEWVRFHADAILEKPFHLGDLFGIIRSLLTIQFKHEV